MSSGKINDGGPAFPVSGNDGHYDSDTKTYPEAGMSLRDWFAGQALGPLIDLAHRNDAISDEMPVRKSTIARWSREIADCLVAELRGDTETESDPEQLSDPTDLKVGDWVQWGDEDEPYSVVRVDGNKFWGTWGSNYAFMNGTGYTVVPAPKGGE